MTNFLQETDSQSWPESDLHFNLEDLTKSAKEQANVYGLRGESNPTRQARDIFSQIQNPSVAEQLSKLLSTIYILFRATPREAREMSSIPPLRAHVDEDGSVLLEWIFSDFRVGFNIEPNPDDSGWHLVSDKTHNVYTASGQLGDMNEVITFLLNLIFSNI